VKDFSEKVALGRTGLQVSRLGIGSSYHVPERACRAAFDAGVNYFFWGSVRTPGMGRALRDLAPRHRSDLVVVLQCYARLPWLMRRSVENGLRKLGLDHVDILLLGWYDRKPGRWVRDEAQRLKDQGKCSFIAISSHQRMLFQDYMRDALYDILQVRYNAAHRGAEQEVFPHLPEEDPPGIVSFTTTRWGDLLQPDKMPPGETPPSATDCYRFALSHPNVDVALSGPKNDKQMAEALAALEQGPLGEDEMERMRRIGDHVHAASSLFNRLR